MIKDKELKSKQKNNDIIKEKRYTNKRKRTKIEKLNFKNR